MPVVHVQASTEACQTIECHLSIRFYVILCRRLGSRNDLSSVIFSMNLIINIIIIRIILRTIIKFIEKKFFKKKRKCKKRKEKKKKNSKNKKKS